MQKDLKIGIVLGLVLAAAAAVWLSTHPSLSIESRILHSNNAASLQETPGSSNNLSPIGLTAEAHSPSERRGEENTENNQLSIINNQSNLPDLTVHEQAEKIKTQRFHIVRKGETLSKISYKYYGSANKWQKILDANRNIIKDANKLRPGAKLIIPD